MSDAVHHIPLDQIDAEAVARDRTRLDPDALAELTASIARSGLRQPIELFELEARPGEPPYGLISGFRRLRAFRDLAARDAARDAHHDAEHEAQHDSGREPRFAAIPAFIRRPADIPAILAAMVEENDIRAGLSPWEKGAVAARAVAEGWHPDLPTALAALYPNANRFKRGRIRTIAELAREMEGVLAEPERLSERDCLRYAAAVTAGFADHIEASLDGALARGHEAQWAIIEQILRESEAFPEEHPIRDGRPNRRPVTRHRKLRTHAVAIRRERTRDGFVLHVTGRDATTRVINEVFEKVEWWLAPE